MKNFEERISDLQNFRNQCVHENENTSGWKTFTSANELGYGEYLEPIVGQGRTTGYHEVLEKICSNTYDGFRLARKTINTYPFGETTDKIYGQLFCVCSGKASFKDSLNYIRGYCRKAKDQLPFFPEYGKSVVLVTDKWDSDVFRKYEVDFLNFCLNEKIVILFYLFNDYGYMQIPFVNSDMMRKYGGDFEIGDESKHRTSSAAKIRNLKYKKELRTTFSPEINNYSTELIIDFDKKKYTVNGRTKTLSSAQAARTRKIIGEAEAAGCLKGSGEPSLDTMISTTLVINEEEDKAVIWYNDGGTDIQEIKDLFANLDQYMK